MHTTEIKEGGATKNNRVMNISWFLLGINILVLRFNTYWFLLENTITYLLMLHFFLYFHSEEFLGNILNSNELKDN